MMPTLLEEQAPVAPPAYHRAQARLGAPLQINALTLVTMLHLLPLCRLAVRLAHRRCPPPLPKGPGGRPRTDPDAAYGHAPAHHPRSLLRGFRVHTLICRGSGLPLLFLPIDLPIHTTPPLHNACWPGLASCIRSVLASSVWMRHTGACG
jgi:hypothetical protein